MLRIGDKEVRNLVTKFRIAIDNAQKKELLEKDFIFRSFPRGCCGDTCYLLAEYLGSKGVETIYVWGNYGRQSHAWLVVKDYRVKEPTQRFYVTPKEIKELLKYYGSNVNDEPKDVTRYENYDLIEGLIIDITADQFGQEPVYVGYMNDFYRRFEFEAAHDCNGLYDMRLDELYRTIIDFVPRV